MFTKLITAVLMCTVGAGALAFGIQEQKIQKDSKPFMQRKLDDVKEIVTGLALEDYDLMSKSAQDLMLLSHESEWNVFQSESYLHMSREFRGSAQRLRDSANDKNLDGATLAYFEVTLNCIRCHKYVRQTNDLKKK